MALTFFREIEKEFPKVALRSFTTENYFAARIPARKRNITTSKIQIKISVNLTMHFRLHWKTAALTSILIIGPVMLSMMSTSCDNETPIYEIIDQETIAIEEGNYPDVLIQIRYIPKLISAAWDVPYKEVSGALYATSPAPPRIINKISKLSITMNETYSQNYPALAELNSLFDVVNYPDKSFPSLNYPIEIGENWSLYLYLREPPDIDLTTRFTITTTMDNGRVMTSQTTFITILK